MFYPTATRFFGGALFCFLFSPVFAASFDCSKATIYAEKFICADDKASKLDEDISVIYKNLLPIDGDEVKETQLQWLALRNSCKTPDCIYKTSNDRKTQLLGGADNFFSYLGIVARIGHNIVIGMRRDKVLYVRFLSMNKNKSDCNFILVSNGDVLKTEDGFSFPISYSDNGFSIHFDNPKELGTESMCGAIAKLPKKIRLFRTQLTVEY